MSLILSTAISPLSMSKSISPPREVVLITPTLNFVKVEIERTKAHMESLGFGVIHTESLEEAVSLTVEEGVYLCMVELFEPVLRNISSSQLVSLQRPLRSARAVIWANAGGRSTAHSDYAIVDGLCRALSNENTQLAFITIAFDMSDHLKDHQIEALGSVIRRSLSEDWHENRERQFVEFDGQLEIGRIVPDDDIPIPSQTNSTEPALLHLHYPSIGPHSIIMKDSERLDSFYCSPLNRTKELTLMEVELETLAVGINNHLLPVC
jgi:hypothetical protein